MRARNALERVNREQKRSKRAAFLFPNTASLLHLANAVAIEISEEWETDCSYRDVGADREITALPLHYTSLYKKVFECSLNGYSLDVPLARLVWAASSPSETPYEYQLSVIQLDPAS